MRHTFHIMTGTAFAILSFLVSACGGTDAASLEPPTAAPAKAALATTTPTVPLEFSPTPNMYGLIYDPGAEPFLPPEETVSMSIWKLAIPIRPVEGRPRFIPSQPPSSPINSIALLVKAGCNVENGNDAICEPDSPLTVFGCEYIRHSEGTYPDLGAGRAIVGRCYSVPPAEDQPREDYLFRVGCAFRRNASHIIKAGDRYILLDTPESLKSFFGPIETSEEALSYAQMMTGLVAHFTFESDPSLLYFQDSMEGTRVIETDAGYRMNLFHYEGCHCEPWIESAVEIIVDRSGGITWLGAVPISMTTGFSCRD